VAINIIDKSKFFFFFFRARRTFFSLCFSMIFAWIFNHYMFTFIFVCVTSGLTVKGSLLLSNWNSNKNPAQVNWIFFSRFTLFFFFFSCVFFSSLSVPVLRFIIDDGDDECCWLLFINRFYERKKKLFGRKKLHKFVYFGDSFSINIVEKETKKRRISFFILLFFLVLC